jgi:hypothetical protein
MSLRPESLEVSVEQLHAQTLERITRSRPRLISIGRALEAIPRMRSNMILHPGPPATWEHMNPILQGAVVGALLYEGVAETEAEARDLVAQGRVALEPCHDHGAVCPGASVISPSMPVCIIKNETFNNLAYCTLNEGGGRVIRYGAYKADAIDRLEWVEKSLAPVLRQAVAAAGGLDLAGIMAQAVQMGDNLGQQTKAATALLVRMLAPYMVRTCSNREMLWQILFFLDEHATFFQNLAMAAAKAALDAARGIPGSRLVTAMAMNGADFGIQISGLGDAWFTAAMTPPDGAYLPGYGPTDASPLIGDGPIMEAYGLGAFVLANSPAPVLFMGGTLAQAQHITETMYQITAGANPLYALPALSLKGTPTGIDAGAVASQRLAPQLHVEILNKEPGGGAIGMALWQPPLEPFEQAIAAME